MLRTNLLNTADLSIVFCQGTITGKEDIDILRQAVTANLTKVNVVLDLSEVDTFGPEALAALVALWHKADQQASRLAIFNPSLPFCLELRRIRSLCPIAILTDAELLRLLRHSETLESEPWARPAEHWGTRLFRTLRHAAAAAGLLLAPIERVFGVQIKH